MRTSTLAELSAAELCALDQVGDRVKRERASYCRYAMLDRDFIAVNINDAATGDDGYVDCFFQSFRCHDDSQ